MGRWWSMRGSDGQPSSGRGRIRSRPSLLAAVIAAFIIVYYALLTEGGQAVWRALISGLLMSLAFALRRLPAVARSASPHSGPLHPACRRGADHPHLSACGAFRGRLPTHVCRRARPALFHALAPTDGQPPHLPSCRASAGNLCRAGGAIPRHDVAFRKDAPRWVSLQSYCCPLSRNHRRGRALDVSTSPPPPLPYRPSRMDHRLVHAESHTDEQLLRRLLLVRPADQQA